MPPVLAEFAKSPHFAWVFAAMAAASAILPQVRNAWRTLMGLVVVQESITDRAASDVLAHAWRVLKHSPLGHPLYDVATQYVRPTRRWMPVALQLLGRGSQLTFFHHGFPVTFTAKAPRPGEPDHPQVAVSYVRGTFNLQKFLLDALAAEESTCQAEGARRFHVQRVFGARRDRPVSGSIRETVPSETGRTMHGVRYLGWRKDDIGVPSQVAPFQGLFYPPDVMEAVEEVRRWARSRDWFEARGLSWRMGALVAGGPGTGKTSLIRALGQELDWPIHVYDLMTMDNQDLAEAWHNSLSVGPVIIAFEDLDRLFECDEEGHVRLKCPVTLDALLNALSGVEPAEGVLVLATANEPELLSDALGVPREFVSKVASSHSVKLRKSPMSSRPGRLDLFVHIGPVAEAQRLAIAQRILADCPDMVALTVKEGAGDTAAQFSFRCARLALDDFWGRVEEWRAA